MKNLREYLFVDYPDFVLTDKSISNQIGNPNAPIRQRLGLARNNEQDTQYRQKALNKDILKRK